MWSERVALAPIPDAEIPSAAEPNGKTGLDEEARLQAAIAMTQLSSPLTLSPGDQVHWCHLAVGGTNRKTEEDERKEDSGQEGGRKAVVMEELSSGAVDPETEQIRPATEGKDSTPTCPAQARSSQKVTCVMHELGRESGRALLKSCEHAEDQKPDFGSRSKVGTTPLQHRIEVKANRGELSCAKTEEICLLDELDVKGKFVRTAQPVDPADAFRVGKTSDQLAVKYKDLPLVKSKDTLIVKSEKIPVVNCKISNDTLPSKLPRQRKPPRGMTSQSTGGKRSCSKDQIVRHRSTGSCNPPAITNDAELCLAHDIRQTQSTPRIIFAFNPLRPLAPLVPIRTMTTGAERHITRLPLNIVSVPLGLSLVTTTLESIPSVVSPSSAAPRHDALLPQVTSTLPSILPAYESFSDTDTPISPDAAFAATISTSRRSSKRATHRNIPGGKSKDVRLEIDSSGETFPDRAFQVEKKETKSDDARLIEVNRADHSIKDVPQIESTLGNKVFEFESIECVDLSTKKSRNSTGETPTFESSTASKLFAETETKFGSCTSPLDLTNHPVSYASLPSQREIFALLGSNVKVEIDNYTNFGNSQNTFHNGVFNFGPANYNVNRVIKNTSGMRGLAQTFGHSSVISDMKGTRPDNPTSLMIREKNSPSAETSVDKQVPANYRMGKVSKDLALEFRETGMSFTDPKRPNSVHSGTVRQLSYPQTKDAACATLSASVIGEHNCEGMVLENTDHSRPGSQCRNHMQAEDSFRLHECRLPPKKRKMHVKFDMEIQPYRANLDQDSLKSSSQKETAWNVNHLKRSAPNYHEHLHLTLAEQPLPVKGCAGDVDETMEGLKESDLRDATSAVEIVVTQKLRDEEGNKELQVNDGRYAKTATVKQELLPSEKATIVGACALSALSLSSSSSASSSLQSPTGTTTNGAIHSAIKPDEDGDLPLHVAVAQGLELVVDSLVSVMSQLHTHIDTFNRNRQTPLHVAVITNQPDIVRKLLCAGACPNLSDRKGHNSVHLAVNNSCHECLRILQSESKYPIDVNAMNYEGLMPLHLAVQLGDVNSLEALLSIGAEVNGVDGKNGRTALYYAAEKSDLATAELLLQAGASPSIASYSGCLPINAARSNGAMVKLLEKYSAGGEATMGMERTAAAAAAAVAGGCGVVMATTQTGNRDAKRRESKKAKSKETKP